MSASDDNWALALNTSLTDGSQKSIALPYQTSSSTVTTSASVLLISVQLVAANPNRKAFYIWNNSANSAYITFGPTSVSSTPTFILATFATLGPQQYGMVCWTGAISAIRNAGSGTLTIYELT